MNEHKNCFWYDCFACEGGVTCEDCKYILGPEDSQYSTWVDVYEAYRSETLSTLYGFFKRRFEEYKLTKEGKPLLR